MLDSVSAVSAFIIVATAAAAVVGLGLSAIAWRRETPAANAFALFVLASSAWNVSSVALWLSPNYQSALLFRVLAWEFAVVGLLGWLYFTLEYTGRTEEFGGWQRKVVLGWLGLFMFAVPVDPWLNLLRENYRLVQAEGLTLIGYEPLPLFQVQLLITYGLILFSYWVMFRFYRNAHPGQRTQAGLILLADLLFAAATFAYYAGGLSLHPFLDPSPLFFSTTVVLIAVALFYYDFLDVTPLAMDLLLEEMQDPIVVVDNDGEVVDTNDPGRAIGVVPGEPLAETCPTLGDLLDNSDETVTLRTADGDERTYDLSITPVSDHHNQHRGKLLVLRDITMLKQREWELREKNEELEEFAHVVSHDLRNPLNVAHGFATEARESENMETLDRSISAMEEMEELIDDLLTLAKEGRSIDETTPVEFESVAEEAWPFVSDGPTLVVESTGTIEADGHRLSELLGNCFRNAREHARPTVTVRTGVTADGFYVEDDGPGIPPDERDRVFESGVTNSESGSGLGLSIVANIAEAHGWSVSVEEGRDGGARFVFDGVEVSKATDSGADSAR
jgi:signal transduction histidine kinase